MANQVTNRTVNIFIESGMAQKALDALIKKETALKNELAAATNPKQIQRITDELKKLEEPIDRLKKKVSGELSPSFKDTQAAVNSLGLRLKRMSTEDADYSMVLSQYRQANKELDEQRGKIGLLGKAMRSFWQEAKTVAVGVVIGNTVQNMLQTVMGYVTGIVTGSAKISDELADIQRITGLQKNEVKELNNELKKIDTRTATSALRDITIVAGKLGIEGKENLLQFVTAVDKLNIAMGGELGDINQFTTDLGKILNVFEGKITGENITAVGNAIVTLANKGVASGPFIVDFTQRIAAIAKTSNLSLEAVIGLAAGAEESGLKVESAATAIQKILTNISSDIPGAAKVAGIEVEKFNQLFAEKPQEALLIYAKGLVANKKSFSEVTAAFKDQGEDGARVVSTLATIGQKTDFFREKMVLAGGALKDNTAITAAFELKNKTAGAELAKFTKNVAGLFQSSSFQAAGEGVIKLMNGFVNVLKASFGFIKEHGGLIATLGIIYAALTVQLKGNILATIAQRIATIATTVAQTIARASLVAYTIAVEVLSGRLAIVRGAQLLWAAAAAAGAGPLGILLVTVGALAIGVGKLFSRTKELTAEQKLQLEIAKKVSESTGDQVANSERLAKNAANENLQMSERKKAIEELIKINPEFANTLKINSQGHLEGAGAIAVYIKALNEKAEAEAKTSLLIEKIRQKNAIINQVRAAIPQSAGLSDEQVIAVAPKFQAFIGPAKEIVVLDQQIKTLNNQIEKSANDAAAAAKQGAVAITDETKSAGDSIDSLKAKLERLQKEFGATTDSKRREELRKEIKELEAIIAKLEGKDAPGASKFDSLLQKAEAFNKKLRDLQQQSADASISQNQKEIDDAKHKYDEILIEYHKLIKELAKAGIKINFNEGDIKKLEDKEIAGIITRQQKEIASKNAKEFIATATAEYQEALRLSAAYYENQKQLRAKAFVAGEIDEKQYKSDIAAIDSAASLNQLQIAQDYSGQKIKITVDGIEKEVAVVKQADEDLTKFKKDNLEMQTADIIAAFAVREENRKLIEDLDNESQLSTLRARISLARKGSSEEFKAKKDELDFLHKKELHDIEERRKIALQKIQNEFEATIKRLFDELEVRRKIELALVDPNDPDADKKRAGINSRFDNAKNEAEVTATKQKNDRLLAINNDFNALIKAANDTFFKGQASAHAQHLAEQINQYVGYLQNVLNVMQTIDQAKTAKENAELERDKKANDKKKANLEKRLKAGSISQLQFNREIEKLDKEQERKQHDADVKQFNRRKKASIIQAIINGAQGVTQAIATYPFPAVLVPIAFAVATTALEIDQISKQKPPELATGGKLDGPSHADKSKGMPVINPYTGQVQALLEGEEMIGSKRTARDKRRYNVEGTPSQIYSILNGVNGGTTWTSGAVLKPAWSTTRPQQMNFAVVNSSISNVRRFYAGGGQFESAAKSQGPVVDTAIPPEFLSLMKDVVNTNAALQNTLAVIQTEGIPAYMLLTQFEKQQKRLEALRNDAKGNI